LRGERELRFLGFSRQLFPQRPLFALTFSALFGIQPCALFGLRLDPGCLRGRADFIDDLRKTRHLFMDGLRRGGWIGGRNEGAGLKRLVDEGSEIPDAKLTRDLERGQRLSMISAMCMRRFVAGDPHLVKKVGDFSRNHAFEFQATEQVGLRLLWARKQAGLCSGELSEQLAELAKLDEGGAGIIAKVPLGRSAKPHQLHIMFRKETEVGTLDWRVTHRYRSPGVKTKEQIFLRLLWSMRFIVPNNAIRKSNQTAKLHNLKEKISEMCIP
jgi:hypothetical protein